MKPIAILIARGGSKRVPRKNVRIFCGLPMIAWSTSTAVNSGMFEDVIISTEDSEIAEVAIKYGARMLFERPQHLADDHAGTAEVIKHSLEFIQIQGRALPDYACCLYGTSAMVTPTMLKDAYERLSKQDSELVMAVTEYIHPIERALCLDENGLLTYRQPKFALMRTQDIPASYHDIGLFYFFNINAFLRHGGASFSPMKKCGIVVDRFDAVDIDSESDWALAEFIFSKKHTL